MDHVNATVNPTKKSHITVPPAYSCTFTPNVATTIWTSSSEAINTAISNRVLLIMKKSHHNQNSGNLRYAPDAWRPATDRQLRKSTRRTTSRIRTAQDSKAWYSRSVKERTTTFMSEGRPPA